MTAELLPDTHDLSSPNAGSREDVASGGFLAGLSRHYPLVLITDESGRVRWMSQEYGELCAGEEPHVGHDLRSLISRVTKREEALALRSELRKRGCLSNARVEISDRSGAPLCLEFSLLPLSDRTDEAGLSAVIARPTPAKAPPAPIGLRGSGFEAALLAGSPDPLVVIDAEGYVRFANRAVERLLGHAPADLMGQSVALLCWGARDLEGLLGALDQPDDVRSLELTLRRNDDGAVCAAGSAAALPSEAGLPGALVVSLRDATPSRRALAELQGKNEDLENCVNTLAHDLRSPLVALLGFSRLLRQDYGARLDDTGLHFVDRIEQAGRTMETLIHDLLELSRIGQSGERRKLVDPRAVLQQLHAELKPRLDANEIELRLPAHPPMVYCDRTRLYQVFSNLIGNAIAHMGPCEDARVEVDVAEEAECEHITVRDQGRGIAPEHQERIFEPFQSFGPRSDERRGSGMGLAIVKKIVKSHGGRVWVESQPGRGAAFHVTFPRR